MTKHLVRVSGLSKEFGGRAIGGVSKSEELKLQLFLVFGNTKKTKHKSVFLSVMWAAG